MRIKNINAFDVRGKIQFESIDPPRPFGKYVFQRTLAGNGNVTSDPTRRLQLRAHIIPFDPQSPAQLALRAKFAAAMAAWHALTPTQKKAWNQTNPGRHISGLNSFISAWMKA